MSNANAHTPDREDLFRNLPIPTALRVMILPAVASQLIVLIYNMADTFFVGQTNNPYMVAGTSLILPLFNLPTCLAGLAGVGGGSLVSRLLGQGREDEARRTATFSLYLGLVIAVVSIVLYEIFAGPLTQIFLEDPQTVGLAARFLRVRVLATPLMFLSFFTVYLFQAFGKGRISLLLGTVRWLVFNIPMLFLLNTLFGMYGLVYFRYRPAMLRDPKVSGPSA